MKRFLLLLALALPLIAGCSKNDDNTPSEQPSNPTEEQTFPQHEGFYRIYAVDNTGWAALRLYMWGSVNDLGGAWPGMSPAGTVTVKGQDYTYFELSVSEALDNTENLIFNNGTGTQLPDVNNVTFGEKADLFFTVTATGAAAFDGGSTWTVDTTPQPVTAKAELQLSLTASDRMMWQIYQVNPKLYGNNGAFAKIEARLDDIIALGNDVLYLMPIYETGKTKSVGSPYCIRDFKSFSTSYGSAEELHSLIDFAHDKGIKVIFDWVANHTAWDCSWTSDHKDWYQQDSGGNIVCPTADGTWSDVAQLNYENKDLRAAMTDAMKYWITEYGIDGYRCDYAHGPTGSKTGAFDAFWKEAIAELRTIKPDLIMLAESDFTKMYDDGFGMIFSRASKSRLVSGFGKDLTSFLNTVSQSLNNAPATGSPLLFVTNHDDCKEASPVSEFRSREGALAAFLLMRSLPVATMMYGSQEVGYPQTIDFFKTVNFQWNTLPEYTRAFKEAMAKLVKIDRNAKLNVWTAGPVILLQYYGSPAGIIIINTSAAEVTVTGLAATAGGSMVLKGYEYRIL